MNKKVVTRFAPSPTGFLHVGGLRTALYSYLCARHNEGKFILRIEDTDRERFVEGAAEQVIGALDWAGLKYDEGGFVEDGKLISKGESGPYIQSERQDLYKKHIEMLLGNKKAYRCFCTKDDLQKMREEQQARGVPTMYDRRCLKLTEEEVNQKIKNGEPYVVRLNVPREGYTVFKDIVRKRVQFENKLVDDQVLMKSDGFPTYHLAVVVDDHLMGVNTIIRGEEWLPSTPKHLLLYEAFGWDKPDYAHLPLIVDKNKKKLSKRNNDVAVGDYVKKGYLKDAIINFIALLGWNPKTTDEIFNLEKLVEKFELSQVHKSAAVFDTDKLDWINGKYIRGMSSSQLLEKALPYLQEIEGYSDFAEDKDFITGAIELEKPRIKKLDELPDAIGFFFAKDLKYETSSLIWKKSDQVKTKDAVKKALEWLRKIAESDFTKDYLEENMLAFAKEQGIDNGTMFWPLRYALSGKDRSPSPFEIMGVLGKKRSLERIEFALQKLDS